MKIGIIGAGLAGLTCARELERNRIKYSLYEKNDYIGEQFNHVGALIQVIHRPVKDYIKYFNREFGINMVPLNTVNTIIHYSPNRKNVIKGNLGVFFKRGRDNDSMKNQLFSKLKNPKIMFNTVADYKELQKKYDHLVIGTGNVRASKELGCFQTWTRAIVRGATVHGNFNPNEMSIWLNRDFCKNGYAYLTPFNDKMASIVLVVTDILEKEIEFYWEKFLFAANLKYTIIEEFNYEHVSGYGYPHKVENLFFAGNSAGIIDPFLGFGIISSISMGVYAARSIIKGIDYEKQLKHLINSNIQLYQLRKAFNNLSNRQLDKLIISLGLPGIKQLIYDTNIDIVKYIAKVLKQ